ncbi:hypothetical protein LSTR_LSTR005301 [Laodelphax striatellus]|uniref:Uncharacterized protein n=1 Tax=Laodelphax striatellus TaxID=195883 RepID=A0A482X7G5_LAOST|nr:hypothetical protein LSTR_LSTR005301 [Laodelphax striatellus]
MDLSETFKNDKIERIEKFYKYISEYEKTESFVGNSFYKPEDKRYRSKRIICRPCISVYTTDEAADKTDQLLQQRIEEKVQKNAHLNKISEIIRRLRNERMQTPPMALARSSGSSTRDYVYGPGFVYGVGYDHDHENSATAPGFEQAHPKCISEAILKSQPLVRAMSMHELYKKIFNTIN